MKINDKGLAAYACSRDCIDKEGFLEKKYSSINSRRRKLQTLRLFFDFLVENEAYPENPIKKIASAPKSLLPPAPTTYPEIFMAVDALKKQKESRISLRLDYKTVRTKVTLEGNRIFSIFN